MNSSDYFKQKKNIQLIVQTTLDCNLRCKHCYEGSLEYPKQTISLEKVEQLIKLAQSAYHRVDYLWFGGEPLIAGLDFFRSVVDLQNEHKQNCQIHNSVQTNGVLIDQEWIDFFKLNKFDISISFDAQFNDVLRQDTNKVIEAINLCKSNHINVTTISTITSQSCDYQFEMYEYLKNEGLLGKFNRIFSEGSAKKNSEYLIEDQHYINSMKTFFSKWIFDSDAQKNSSIDICLRSLFNFDSKECIYSGCLFKWLAVAPNGDIYPCPRFSGTNMKLGNVMQIRDINGVFFSDAYKSILEDNLERIKKCQKTCLLFPYCHSGCNARSYWSGDITQPSVDICSYVKEFFPYVVKTIMEIVNSDQRELLNPYMKALYNQKQENFLDTFEYFKENHLI